MVSEELPQRPNLRRHRRGRRRALGTSFHQLPATCSSGPDPGAHFASEKRLIRQPFHATFSLPFGITARIEQPNALVNTPSRPGATVFRPISGHSASTGRSSLACSFAVDTNSNSSRLLTPRRRTPTNLMRASTDSRMSFRIQRDSRDPSGYGYSVLGQDVGPIFEGEFGSRGSRPLAAH